MATLLDLLKTTALWVASGAIAGVIAYRWMRWRDRARKGLILALLTERGPMTGSL